MASLIEIMQLCRLCLVKDQVNIPIFEEQGDVRQIFLKLAACFPTVQVSRDDNLPKKICESCMFKLEHSYQFWSLTTNAEKQLNVWLKQIGLDANSKVVGQQSLQMVAQSHAHPHSLETETVILKQEAIDPIDVRPDIGVSSDTQSYILQQQQLPYQPVGFQYEQPPAFSQPSTSSNTGPSATVTSATNEPAMLGKRKRRQVITNPIPSSEESDDDEDIQPPKIAKEEEDSDSADDNEPLQPTAFVSVPAISQDAEQPGPSGLNKPTAGSTSEAPKMEFHSSLPQTEEEIDTVLRFMNRSTWCNAMTDTERNVCDARVTQLFSENDDEQEPFEYEEEDDDDNVPQKGAASDVEEEVEVDFELHISDDEEDIQTIYDESVAAISIAGPIKGEPLLCRSKDGKYWRINSPPAGRTRVVHNRATAAQAGPIIGTIRNPISIFKMLLTPEIVGVVAQQTNRRANESYRIWNESHPTMKQRNWEVITEKELYAFFGLLLFSGVFGQNSQPAKELWADYNHPIYKATMSYNRFKRIITYIRFDNGNTRAARLQNSKSAAIDDVWLMLMANLGRAYIPHDQITIDIQLFPYRGRTRFTQFIPSKAAKYGIKLWWVCDSQSNYPLKGIICTGKPPGGGVHETNRGERAVLNLVEKYANTGRTVYADSYFSTVSLAQTLITKNFAYVGTVRTNKTFVPPVMLDVNRAQFSTVFGFYNNEVALCSYMAKMKKPVIMLSTEHYECVVDATTATRKPLQIVDYNNFKSGVDTMDQMLTGYTCKRSTNRWPLAMFYNMLDIAGLAAFIIHDELHPERITDKRRSFVVALARQLVIPHMEIRTTNPKVRAYLQIRRAMDVFSLVVVPKIEPMDAQDRPSYSQVAAHRPSCASCKKLGKNQRKTRFRCIWCQKPVCVEHSITDYHCKTCP